MFLSLAAMSESSQLDCVESDSTGTYPVVHSF